MASKFLVFGALVMVAGASQGFAEERRLLEPRMGESTQRLFTGESDPVIDIRKDIFESSADRNYNRYLRSLQYQDRRISRQMSANFRKLTLSAKLSPAGVLPETIAAIADGPTDGTKKILDIADTLEASPGQTDEAFTRGALSGAGRAE